MKVITEERLREIKESMIDGTSKLFIHTLIRMCKEIETLTPKETDLILAAEKYAEKYSADDRQDIKTDVINAFYHGAEWHKVRQN